VLARPVESFGIHYLDATNVDAAVPNAVKIRLTMFITLPATSNQPASQMQLTSDVTLRNAPMVLGRY
jgi:hypothetical protein